MGKRMKMPFLNKSFSSSFSSNSNSSSSWAWPSCHQNPRTTSFRATIIEINTSDVEDEEEEEEKPLHEMISSSLSLSSSTSSTIDAVEELPETESIENVIKGIKSSKRLIFERKGESNSILEELGNKDSCSCPWNHSTFSSLISSESWLKWLRYTRFITTREASKCVGKTTK